MPDKGAKPYRTRAGKARASKVSEAGLTPVADTPGADAPRKKNLRLHQWKIDEAKEILGTATETETIEVALDLVVLRKELVDGVHAMHGAKLLNLFDDADA